MIGSGSRAPLSYIFLSDCLHRSFYLVPLYLVLWCWSVPVVVDANPRMLAPAVRTACPGSIVHIYLATGYTKIGKTSWAGCISNCRLHVFYDIWLLRIRCARVVNNTCLLKHAVRIQSLHLI